MSIDTVSKNSARFKQQGQTVIKKTKFWCNNLVILTTTPLKGPTVMNERQEE